MNQDRIQQAVVTLKAYLAEHPQHAISPDKTARATLESGLRIRSVGPTGEMMVTDMPAAIGGGDTAPTPGWYLRAALANCDATMIALRAAQLGIKLGALEVTVGSQSDNRGLVCDDTDIPAGPLSVHIDVRIEAQGVKAEDLRELVRWAEHHSPVGDALRRAIDVTATVHAGVDESGA